MKIKEKFGNSVPHQEFPMNLRYMRAHSYCIHHKRVWQYTKGNKTVQLLKGRCLYFFKKHKLDMPSFKIY